MTFIITPYVIVSALAALVALVVAVLAWRRRPAPGRKPLVALMLAVGIWSAGAALEYATVGVPGKLLWAKVQYIGVLTCSVFYLLLTLEYTQEDYRLTTRSRALLFAVPLFTFCLAATNEWHGLIWPSITLAGAPEANLAIYDHGIAFWLGSVAYSYLLMLIGALLLLRAALRSATVYRGQAALLMMAALAPWLVNLVYITGFSPLPGLELTPLVMVFTGGFFAWSIFRFHLLDLAPVARERLIETMADGMIVLDPDDRIIDFNPAAQRLLGSGGPIALGQQAEAIFAAWRQWMDHGAEGPATHVQTAIIDLPGRCLELSISSLPVHRSRSTGRLVVLHDITAIRAAQTEIEQLNADLEQRVVERTKDLADSQQQFRQVITSISDHVFAFQIGADGSLETIYSSPRLAELTGHSVAEIAGSFPSHIAVLVHPEDRQKVNAFLLHLLDHDASEVEHRIIRSDGSVAWMHTSARSQTQNQQRYVFGVTSDITARKQMEQIEIENRAMVAVDRLRTELIGNVSHELRTPLGLIKMGSTTLERRDVAFPVAVQQQILHDITREADHLDRLVLNLLDMSRFDQNRLVLDYAVTDINRLITDLVSNMQHLGTRGAPSPHKFVLRLPQRPLMASVDALKVEQVVRNLVENAIRYSPGRAQVAIELDGDNSAFEIRVIDHGIGVSVEEQEHIFERFYRSHSAYVQRVRGAGLGLSICREIVRAHQGEIYVLSEPGCGATFTVNIPSHAFRSPNGALFEEVSGLEHGIGQDTGR